MKLQDQVSENMLKDEASNWMAEEIKYEATRTAWRLDEGAAYLDEEHRKHCEAREIKRNHERMHQKYGGQIQYKDPMDDISVPDLNKGRPAIRNPGKYRRNSAMGTVVFVLIIIIYIIVFLTFFRFLF